MKRSYLTAAMVALIAASCSDDADEKLSWEIGEGSQIDYPEEYFAGGQLGTTTNNSSTAFKQPSLAVENAGMVTAFNEGEYLFENDFNTNTSGAFQGLGPVYVRPGCLYCHPGYGHGARQNTYSANLQRNGYLLVIYDKLTDAYIRSVAGMPQTGAVKPFKAPIDESQIVIEWNNYTDEWGNKFDDGESYELTYPEVTIPATAYYAPVYVLRDGKDVEIPASEYADNIGIRLESTIGIYGTGLLDAIPDEDITAQWKAESPYVTLNPAMWDQTTDTWKSYYSNSLQGDGTKYVRRYTYALSRGPVLDGAGANAICEILALRKPNILIPLSAQASRGDQILNARSFERQGYSVVLEEEELNHDVLLDAIMNLYQNRETYIQAMKNSPQQNSIDTIIDLIEAATRH